MVHKLLGNLVWLQIGERPDYSAVYQNKPEAAWPFPVLCRDFQCADVGSPFPVVPA
jgi:hypothetical protein